MPESRLVKEVFFVSPIYWDEFQNIEHYENSRDNNEEWVRGKKPDDKRDVLPDWLGENSIPQRVRTRSEEVVSGSYIFVGKMVFIVK